MKRSLNNRGIALVQVMIAIGLIGVISLGVMTLADNMFKNHERASRLQEELEFRQTLIKHFSDQASCTNSIKNIGPAGSASGDIAAGATGTQSIKWDGYFWGTLRGSDGKLINCPSAPATTKFCPSYNNNTELSFGKIRTNRVSTLKYDATPGFKMAELTYGYLSASGEDKTGKIKIWTKVDTAGRIEYCAGAESVDYDKVTATICEQFNVDGKKGVYNPIAKSCTLEATHTTIVTSPAPTGTPVPPTGTYAVEVVGFNGPQFEKSCPNGVSSWNLSYSKCFGFSGTYPGMGDQAQCTLSGNAVRCTQPACNQGAYLTTEGIVNCKNGS
ncbi:hypothetical protein [Bdellovibrio bacteriovorus]|nr:hypothetical protein [Bdellovibrio bacteriovorus]